MGHDFLDRRLSLFILQCRCTVSIKHYGRPYDSWFQIKMTSQMMLSLAVAMNYFSDLGFCYIEFISEEIVMIYGIYVYLSKQ